MTVPAGRSESRGIATPHQPTWIQRLMATLVFVAIRAVAVIFCCVRLPCRLRESRSMVDMLNT